VQIDPNTLPNDPATLHQMLRVLLHQQGELNAENDKLRLLIQRLTRQQFGRRSEQLTADQLQFGLEDLEQTVAEVRPGRFGTDRRREPGGTGCGRARSVEQARGHQTPSPQPWRLARPPTAL
jgi:hypothetical protein